MPDRGALSQRARWAGGEPIANLLMARTLAQPELISLAAGFVDTETLPVELTAQALEAVWSDVGRARVGLQYGTTIGYPPLRDAVLGRMLAADRCTASELNVSIDQVVVTAGSNQLLYLVADTVLNPGDMVLCGAPTYFVFQGTLGNMGAQAVGCAIDEHGLIPEAVEEELVRRDKAGELGRVKMIYVTTYYDNPTGRTVPAQRRAALVEVAQRWSRKQRIYVVDDAAYRELRYYGDDIASLRSFDPDGTTVIHAGTFSKSFSPGIRVGWGVLPKALVEPVLAAKGNLDFGSPNLNQLLMATVLEMDLFDPHVERIRASYREKIDATLAAADEHLAGIEGVEWVPPTGGLYLWVRLPEPIDAGLAGPLFDKAVEEGVLYVPGEYCYPAVGEPICRNTLRLSFGIQSCESIRRGIEALARAIHQVL